jgi:hypothetical protein
VWDGKIPGICVDSRAINRFTLPERATFPPMHELLLKDSWLKVCNEHTFITDISTSRVEAGMKKVYVFLVWYLGVPIHAYPFWLP